MSAEHRHGRRCVMGDLPADGQPTEEVSAAWSRGQGPQHTSDHSSLESADRAAVGVELTSAAHPPALCTTLVARQSSVACVRQATDRLRFCCCCCCCWRDRVPRDCWQLGPGGLDHAGVVARDQAPRTRAQAATPDGANAAAHAVKSPRCRHSARPRGCVSPTR